ncbi:acyltransferase domain-containing protein [Actinomadura yumaensis]|uniref:acyltransferase domain-containing protein n=1 Tax=Actinomadura yumaensis TaxID=111807 RepID=UPI00361FB625
MGHTHAAAGVAGLIKMVMALRNETLPANLHLSEPTPHVDWDTGAVRLLTAPVPWPRDDRPRRAGVSSFGISGTNAHLIVEEAPEPADPSEAAAPPEPDSGAVVPWVLSGRSEEALRGQAAALAARVGGSEGWAAADVGWSLVTTRSVFEHRAVVVGSERDELLDGLKALAAGEAHPNVVHPGSPAVSGANARGPVLVFPGQGSQWAGMGAELLDSSPVFAARIAECECALAPFVDWSLSDVLRGDGAELTRVDVVQPVLWATMVSLAAVWASYGVVPSAVIGHSQGEIAAACVAGALSLEDGARIVAVRGQELRRLSGRGAMASLGVGEERAGELVEGDVTVAAVNGPSSTVVSGPPEQVAAVVARAEAAGHRARTIDVDYASHGPQIELIGTELTEKLAGVRPVRADVGFYSTVTGGRIDTAGLDTVYWVTNLRLRVRFAETVRALLDDGHRVFIEASPHPVLTVGLEECFEQAGTAAVAVPTLRRGDGGAGQVAKAAGQAFAAGARVDWTGWFRGRPAAPRVVDLPTYAFQRERYWLEGLNGDGGDPAGLGLVPAGHPLLGAAVEVADGDIHLLTGRLPGNGNAGWLADHRVLGTVLVPGTALLEWALRAADEAGCGSVEELVLHEPMVLPGGSGGSGGLRVQVVVGAAGEDGRREVRVSSRPGQEDSAGERGGEARDWVCHASGVLAPETTVPAPGLDGIWPPPGAEAVDVSDVYERVAASGYEYGPAFQGLRALWRHGTDLLAEVALPDAAGKPDGFGVHPALLDAALHPALLEDGDDDAEGGGERRVWLPFAWNGVSLRADGATAVRVRLSPEGDGADERKVRVTVADAVGGPVLDAESVVMRPADIDRLKSAGRPGAGGAEGLFTVEWTALPEPAAEPSAEDDTDHVTLAPTASAEDGASYAGLDGLAAALDGGLPAPSVVLAEVGAVADALALVQRWLAEPRLSEARLAVVTRGAVACENPVPDGAGVWGLVRSAQAENPGRFVLLDVGAEADAGADAGSRAEQAEAVRRAVRAGEPQVAWRDGRLLVPRWVRAGEPVGIVPPPGERAWRLGLSGTATLENVSATACPEALEPLEPGQVRIDVHAAGVNFRDVLIALGMYPGDAAFGGSEGAGVVTEVGPDVAGLAAGDRVMGLFDGAFGSVAVADARMVAPVPDGWDLRQAAAAPVAFLTAWYGLVHLGALRRGDSVLVHAATGGVGMAAVQVARHVGAEVYATAGPAKHGVLDGMGIDEAHRASSRDLDFEDAVRRATGGRGVDVVLNSLSGPFTDASLRLLADGGRFVEMGKTDVRAPDPASDGMAEGVAYRAFDLLADAGPDRIAEMLSELAGLFSSGALRPCRCGRGRSAARGTRCGT